jgi:purine catabolism regulator
MNSESSVTLSDVLKLTLPLNTAIVGASDQRDRVINWIAILTDWRQVRDQVQLGDLVIIPPALQAIATEAELKESLQTMSSVAISSVLVFDEVSDSATSVAKSLDLPIVVVPSDTSMREIHRSMSSLLIDRQSQVTERGMQLYRQLSEMSREEQGLNAMTDLMSKMTGKIVVVQDKRLDVQAMSIPPDNIIDISRLNEALQQRDQLPVILRNRKAAAKTRQSHWQQLLPVENVARLLTPIVSGDRARGYLSVVGSADELDMLDKLTTEHGAAACALEMAKAKAVSEAKKELRGDFLEGVLAGKLPKAEMERLQSRLDHDTEQPHAILTIAWEGEKAPSVRHLETAVNWILSSHNRPALVHIYGGTNICVFQSLRSTDEDMSTAKEFEKRLREHIEADPDYKEHRLISGLAGPVHALAEWSEHYQRAVQAMKLAQRLKLNSLVEYDSLGVYQLLTQLDDIPAVHTFSEQVIGPLAEYDKRHRSNLVNTIAAYFEHHGNISQTAESLFIHRNTLLYRLDRIGELTQHELDQSDMRLSLHLALKLWQLRPDT